MKTLPTANDVLLFSLLAIVWSLIRVRAIVRWLRDIGALPPKKDALLAPSPFAEMRAHPDALSSPPLSDGVRRSRAG